jgi:hypothetical protein
MENIASKVENDAKRNSQAMAECDNEISVIDKRKQRLLAANHQYHLLADLKTSGASSWNQLRPKKKWKKEKVLAVFLSGKIPPELTEKSFQQCAPETIRNNRDIFLACVASKMFYSRVIAC